MAGQVKTAHFRLHCCALAVTSAFALMPAVQAATTDTLVVTANGSQGGQQNAVAPYINSATKSAVPHRLQIRLAIRKSENAMLIR